MSDTRKNNLNFAPDGGLSSGGSSGGGGLDRVLTLLAERAAGGLDRSELAELDSALAALPAEARAEAELFDQQMSATIGVTLATLHRRGPSMPTDARARLLSRGLLEMEKPAGPSAGATGRGVGPDGVHVGRADAGRADMGREASPLRLTGTTGGVLRRREIFAWATAAAAIVFAMFAWIGRPAAGPTTVASWEARRDLLGLPQTQTFAWSATQDPSAQGVSGDVVWNNEKQEGYLRFRGLAQNDPRIGQYQLWIFDKGREPEFPVDGGVFDITLASRDPSSGDLVVPIKPTLQVRDPSLFAVTIELPGGVVVTKKERLLLLASAGANP